MRSASSEACPRRRIVGKGGLPGNVPFSKHFADDELLAARGLSPKLLPGNIPEFRVIASSLDRLDGLLRAQGRSLAVRVRAMARASVVLRGVRGYHGVRWLNGPLFWPSTFRLLTAPAAAGARRGRGHKKTMEDAYRMRQLGRVLHKAFIKESQSRDDRCWAAHREGRHGSVDE